MHWLVSLGMPDAMLHPDAACRVQQPGGRTWKVTRRATRFRRTCTNRILRTVAAAAACFLALRPRLPRPPASEALPGPVSALPSEEALLWGLSLDMGEACSTGLRA